MSLLSYYLLGCDELINHFLLQPRLQQKAGTARQSAVPWVEENGIIAQVIGGGASLISDLINLIKAPSLLSPGCFSGTARTEGAFQNGLIHPDECHTRKTTPRKKPRLKRITKNQWDDSV